MNMYRGPQSRKEESEKEKIFVGYLFLFCALGDECGCFFHPLFVLGSDARRVSGTVSGIFNFNENIYRHTGPINGGARAFVYSKLKVKRSG